MNKLSEEYKLMDIICNAVDSVAENDKVEA